jgi:hypothetical protein
MKSDRSAIACARVPHDKTIRDEPINKADRGRMRKAERPTHLLYGHTRFVPQQRYCRRGLPFLGSLVFCFSQDRVSQS